MGAEFQRWLARPSTLCFLRRLVASTGDGIPAGSYVPGGSVRRQHAYAPLGDELREKDEKRSKAQTSQDVYQSKGARRVGTKNNRQAVTIRRVDMDDEDQFAGPRRSHEEASILTSEQAFRALWHQADAASRRNIGGLVVDNPRNWSDMKHWVQLLEERQRLRGLPGIVDAWKGMRFRKVKLPVTGPEADFLWPALIDAGIATYVSSSFTNHEMIDEILHHAQYLHEEYGAIYSGLYKCIVGGLARHDVREARRWHVSLLDGPMASICDLRVVAPDFARIKNLWAHRTPFVDMHTHDTQRNIYDHFMPELLEHGDKSKALKWHRHLLNRGDAPGSEVFAMPAVQRLFDLDGDNSLPVVHSKRHQDTTTLVGKAGGGLQQVSLTRSSMSALVGQAHGISSKEVSDPFVAKLFATQAFPLDLVVKALGFFGVERLGPISVHEMAIKAGNLVTFGNQLSALKRLGISADSSVYGRLMTKVTNEGSSKLFEALLASDQHPEAFEDATTQESLLVHHLERGDYSNAHLTLSVLNISGHEQHSRGWNIVLRHQIQQQDQQLVLQTVQQMQTSGMAFHEETLRAFHRHVLPRRARGHAPVKLPHGTSLRPLQLTTRVYMYAAEQGQFVPSAFWKEILKRYGMASHWDELERMVRWLSSWYSHHFRSKIKWRGSRRMFFLGTIHRIFDTQMRKAIVAWGFKDAAARRALRPDASPTASRGEPASSTVNRPCELWARGILLLREVSNSPSVDTVWTCLVEQTDQRVRSTNQQAIATALHPARK